MQNQKKPIQQKKPMQNFTAEKWADKIALFIDNFGFLSGFFWHWTIALPSPTSHLAMLHSKIILSDPNRRVKVVLIGFSLFWSRCRTWGNIPETWWKGTTWGGCTLSKPEIHHRSSSQTSWHRFARQRGSIQRPSEKLKLFWFYIFCQVLGTQSKVPKTEILVSQKPLAQFIHYSRWISWEPRLNQSRYFTLSNYSTSVLEKSISYIIMITSLEDKDKEKYRVSKKQNAAGAQIF